jgi:alpha-N-acetylglucosamine transferase
VRGARVLAHTLRINSDFDVPLVALIVGLSHTETESLQQVGWVVRSIEPIPFTPPNAPPRWKWKPSNKLGRAHVNALSKMRVWTLTQYQRVVFVDSDAWVLGDVSDLCRRREDVVAMGSVAGDLNSGLCSFDVVFLF